MTARVSLSCDGTWGDTFPCRAAYPSRSLSPVTAREMAEREGWSGGPGRDLCPAHTRLQQSGAARG